MHDELLKLAIDVGDTRNVQKLEPYTAVCSVTAVTLSLPDALSG